MENKITRQKFIKELIGIFRGEAGCGIQYGNCPCNTCFHHLDADFQHICWLIVLGLRGDYVDMREQLLSDIRGEFV